MIAKLNGVVDTVDATWLIVMVGGVGYRVFAPGPTLTRVAVGEQVSLHTYTHVREDTFSLFGFAEPEEQALFETLLLVSGVGPRLAMAVLSQLTVAQVVRAVVHGEQQVLTRVSGIGKKTADRLILELKDRLSKWAVPSADEDRPSTADVAAASDDDDIVTALVGLGYTVDASRRAVNDIQGVAAGTDEERLRLALRRLQSQ